MAPLYCGPPAGGKLTKWPAVSKRLDSTALGSSVQTIVFWWIFTAFSWESKS